MTILLDAGPCLNFLAVNQQGILINLAQSRNLQLATPRRVVQEVTGKAENDPRFSRTSAPRTWRILTSDGGWIRVLEDTLETVEFSDAVTRIAGMPASARVRDRSSLGEIMVMAHASVLARSGEQVFVLMDDKLGRSQAAGEIDWLKRRGSAGEVRLWTTPQVMVEASRHPEWISGDKTFRQVYRRMTDFDDGLPKLDALRL